jgi:hypothetical protein
VSLFEPFVRVLGSQESGSGLGRAIARTASQALGGRIELGMRADHRTGSRFVYRQECAQQRHARCIGFGFGRGVGFVSARVCRATVLGTATRVTALLLWIASCGSTAAKRGTQT